MKDDTTRKSTVAEIRDRFDQDVERFSNLQTGQTATVDAPVALEMIARAAAATTPDATRLLDIGCGAGNFSLRAIAEGNYRSVTLVDLSSKMLERARLRLGDDGLDVEAIQGDIRQAVLPTESFDVVLAGAVLHHLRGEQEWRDTFQKIYSVIAPGGSFWIFDLVVSPIPAIAALQEMRYGDYLTSLNGPEYRDSVLRYIEKEDSPRPIMFQLELLKEVGFAEVDVLHFNTRFAAFGAIRA